MTLNPDNFPGIRAVIVGYVGSPAQPPAFDKDGTRGVLEVGIPINHGYRDRDSGEWKTTSTTWVNVQAAGDYAEELRGLYKGDKVRVDNANLETRTYTAKDGTEKIGVTATYGQVTVLERGQAYEEAGDSEEFDDDFDEDDPF